MKKIILCILCLSLVTGCQSKTNELRENKFKENKYSLEEVTNKVNKINEEHYKPTISVDNRSLLRNEIYAGIRKYGNINLFLNCLYSSSVVLSKNVGGENYKELVNQQCERWKAYEENDFFGVPSFLRAASVMTDCRAFQEDLSLASKLCNYGIENRDVLALVDANRIIEDIKVYLLGANPDEEKEVVEAYDTDNQKKYYKVTKTLEGKWNLVSEYNID